MSTPPVRTAQSVSAALRRAGIPTGYRYTAFGYVDRAGVKVTAPGCEVTRNRRARYGGQEDRGHVAVFFIMPTGSGEPTPAFREQVVAALRDAGLPIGRVDGSSVEVLDPGDEPEPVDQVAAALRAEVARTASVLADAEQAHRRALVALHAHTPQVSS